MNLLALPTLEDKTDAQLVEQCLANRTEAQNVLVKRHLKAVYNLIYQTVQDAILAEDLTQETFLRVFKSLRKFDQKRAFRPWLFTIAVNVSKTALIRAQRQPVLLNTESSDMNLLENMPDTHGDIIDTISDTAAQAVMLAALQGLNPAMRQALVLRHVNDLSYEDIAATMQVNLNTVRTWLRRGREHLKLYLETHGGLQNET